MAEEFRKTLVNKDGREVVATSPREYNDLVYGGGYKEKGGGASTSAAPANSPKAATKQAKGEDTT